VNVSGIKEVVTDKGYHSAAVVERVKSYQVRTYMPEGQQPGRRKWAGKAAQQRAVYANRRRVQGNYGKGLLPRRGELVERSFAHCYDTGGMRRTHLRKHPNILKRQLIHVAGFNLSLIFPKLLGAGTPQEWNNLGNALFLLFINLFGRLPVRFRPCRTPITPRPIRAAAPWLPAHSRPCRKIATYTTGC
jgi:transposase